MNRLIEVNKMCVCIIIKHMHRHATPTPPRARVGGVWGERRRGGVSVICSSCPRCLQSRFDLRRAATLSALQGDTFDL